MIETETRKIIEKIIGTIVGSLKRSTKFINLDLTKKIREKIQIPKSRNKRGDLTEIRRILRAFHV